MAALDFPSSPSVGDTHEENGVKFRYNDTGWVPIGAASSVYETITAKYKLDEQELTTAGDFDFNNIDQSYDRLIIEGYVRGDVSAIGEVIYSYLNADTTDANYHRQRSTAAQGANASQESNTPYTTSIPGGSAPSNAYGYVKIVIENYAASSFRKFMYVQGTAYYEEDHAMVGHFVVTSNVTDPVTRVRLRSDNDPTDELLGKLTLYGEKQVDLRTLVGFGNKELIEQITLTSAGEFDFQNIDGKYRNLILEFEDVKSNTGNYTEWLEIWFNNDLTTNNYIAQQHSVEGASVSDAEHNNDPRIVGSTGSPASPAALSLTTGRIIIPGYSSSILKRARGESEYYYLLSSNHQVGHHNFTVFHKTLTAAITRVQLRCYTHPTNQLTGTVRLYGEY